MPKKSAPAVIAPLELDPTSPAIVLAYAGGGRSARNVPARHLSAADLARLAYRRSLAVTSADGVRPDPRTPDPAVMAGLVAELTRFGLYTADPAAIAEAEAELAPAAAVTEPDPAPADPASDSPAAPASTEA